MRSLTIRPSSSIVHGSFSGQLKKLAPIAIAALVWSLTLRTLLVLFPQWGWVLATMYIGMYAALNFGIKKKLDELDMESADRIKRYKARKRRCERLIAWMFPQGISARARTVILVTNTRFAQWHDRFRDIAALASHGGAAVIACRWPRNPRFQKEATELLVKVLQAIKETRSLVVERELTSALNLVSEQLTRSEHACNIYWLVPGKTEQWGYQIHGIN